MSTSPQTLPPPGPHYNAASESHRVAKEPETGEIVGKSAAIERLRTQVQRLGPHFRTVLLSGEAGTGKQLIGRALHRLSSHAAGPFVVFEPAKGDSEASDRPTHSGTVDGQAEIAGLLKLAHRGTLYIDQVGALSAAGQAELLADLKGRERGRGRLVVHGLEARIVASTTENLRVLVASGRFLDELHARLATLEIELSPLRERREDISALAYYFAARYAKLYAKPVQGVSKDAMERLEAYPWPRNTGELKQLLRRAVADCRGGRIECVDIAVLAEMSAASEVATTSASRRLQEVVEQHVYQVLKVCAGNKVRAAEMLGISRSTLYRMLDSGLQTDKLVGLR